MSYGLFNWWWGEDESVVSDKWKNLYILNLAQLDVHDLGSYAYLWNNLAVNSFSGSSQFTHIL